MERKEEEEAKQWTERGGGRKEEVEKRESKEMECQEDYGEKKMGKY
jgi:hypothetical protein